MNASSSGRSGASFAPTGQAPATAHFSRPRLLLVGNFFRVRGGSHQYCRDLAERLTAAGYSVVTVSRWRARPLRLFSMATAPLRLRQRYDVALVDVFSGRSFLWAEAAVAALGAAGRPFVLTLHGGALPAFARRHPRRVARLLGRAAEVTAPSPFLAESMREFRGDIRVIPNALDLARYPFRRRSTLRPHLVWLRAFHRIYAPEVAVRALALLVKEYPDAMLRMVGPDKDGTLGRCSDLVESLGLRDHVELVPGVAREQVPEVLAWADVFLNTTTVDNTPVSLLEAMACGLCVVSTNAGGVPALLHDGENGLLVPPLVPELLAQAIQRLLADPLLAARLSLAGRKSAARHDWAAVMPKWNELLLGSPTLSESTQVKQRNERMRARVSLP